MLMVTRNEPPVPPVALVGSHATISGAPTIVPAAVGLSARAGAISVSNVPFVTRLRLHSSSTMPLQSSSTWSQVASKLLSGLPATQLLLTTPATHDVTP